MVFVRLAFVAVFFLLAVASSSATVLISPGGLLGGPDGGTSGGGGSSGINPWQADDFTIILLPDTQDVVRCNLARPPASASESVRNLRRLGKFLVSKKDGWEHWPTIASISHLGDVVEEAQRLRPLVGLV